MLFGISLNRKIINFRFEIFDIIGEVFEKKILLNERLFLRLSEMFSQLEKIIKEWLCPFVMIEI